MEADANSDLGREEMSCRELTGASKSRRWCRRDRMEQISTNPSNAARQQTERDVLELFVGRTPVRSTEGPSSPVAHTSRALGLTNLKALSVLGSVTRGIVFHVVPADAATTAVTTDAGTGCPPDVDPWFSRPSPAAPFPPRRCGHGQRHRVRHRPVHLPPQVHRRPLLHCCSSLVKAPPWSS
ncbi:hypothetical protein OsI_12868 [Oryza sativa Indica Group]|uniref:Uncharacterized protein n=3 Tax=Oryza sativa TaxID=4530 RepID=A3AL15_ORYSJ|nr:hypothetical protein OsI_12868 [Oryza sativa Indica Group]EAZ28004.1 hypothetical protein OsJ_11971 [Oryza sativa Japonica Group]